MLLHPLSTERRMYFEVGAELAQPLGHECSQPRQYIHRFTNNLNAFSIFLVLLSIECVQLDAACISLWALSVSFPEGHESGHELSFQTERRLWYH